MMHFCKTCGTLYPDSLGGCPRCNAKAVTEAHEQQEKEQPPAAPADRGTVRRQWIAILIGVPAFIGVLYLIIWLYRLALSHLA